MPKPIQPLDPSSPAGIAATEALTEVVASLEVAVAARRRTKQTRRVKASNDAA